MFGLKFADVEASVELNFGWVVTSGTETWLSTCFPDLKTNNIAFIWLGILGLTDWERVLRISQWLAR